MVHQSVPPWIPALAADTIRPLPSDAAAEDIPHHEPLLNVKAVETGVIDVSDGVISWADQVRSDSWFRNVWRRPGCYNCVLGQHDSDSGDYKRMSWQGQSCSPCRSAPTGTDLEVDVLCLPMAWHD